ncbi:type III pantothenate kinase [Aureitalea sp. L0-47]|uniref:type III pantothenate kinase n=1 Tax=Aureitalea sp. L0-47 TaxID=2816962 RepID=UPI0022387155|nr:type III pantothenate kinase [Aureitalea sp. L0-47]MCW5518688.1 type III pantothenate kinase [Aureitalea sp. L0-47]
MNLIIDVGNTRIKLAVFSGNKLLQKYSCAPNEVLDSLKIISKSYPEIQHCIMASVGTIPKAASEFLDTHFTVLTLSSETNVPFNNGYGSPHTLGVDRIALASAAATSFAANNVLVIDAGSCITYDFISEENTYLGGAISPGIGMRYKAVHTFTANLPLLEPTLPIAKSGSDTNTSIHSGVLQGVLFEIEGYINMYREKYPDLTVILTGGDAHFLRDSLKSDIFANSNFLLEGLNFILEHNKH